MSYSVIYWISINLPIWIFISFLSSLTLKLTYRTKTNNKKKLNNLQTAPYPGSENLEFQSMHPKLYLIDKTLSKAKAEYLKFYTNIEEKA